MVDSPPSAARLDAPGKFSTPVEKAVEILGFTAGDAQTPVIARVSVDWPEVPGYRANCPGFRRIPRRFRRSIGLLTRSPRGPRNLGFGMAGTVWDEVLGRIETKVNRYSYYTWFRQTSLATDDGDTLWSSRVADPMAADWLTKHYAGDHRRGADRSRPARREVCSSSRRRTTAVRTVAPDADSGRLRERARRAGSHGLPKKRTMTPGSAPAIPSTRSSSAPRISSRMRRAARSPKRRRVRTTRCFSTAASDLARRI